MGKLEGIQIQDMNCLGSIVIFRWSLTCFLCMLAELGRLWAPDWSREAGEW